MYSVVITYVHRNGASEGAKDKGERQTHLETPSQAEGSFGTHTAKSRVGSVCSDCASASTATAEALPLPLPLSTGIGWPSSVIVSAALELRRPRCGFAAPSDAGCSASCVALLLPESISASTGGFVFLGRPRRFAGGLESADVAAMASCAGLFPADAAKPGSEAGSEAGSFRPAGEAAPDLAETTGGAAADSAVSAGTASSDRSGNDAAASASAAPLEALC